MKDITEKDLEKTEFGKNKFYVAIIQELISQYSKMRYYPDYGDDAPQDRNMVRIENDVIIFHGEERVGPTEIKITIKNGNLVVNIGKTSYPYRFNTFLVYDEYGVMLKKVSWSGLYSKETDQEANINDLDENYDYLEENGNDTISRIFDYFSCKVVTRPDNFGPVGKYIHKIMKKNSAGEKRNEILAGDFDILELKSLFSLDFPDEDKVRVTREENYKREKEEPIYPSPFHRK